MDDASERVAYVNENKIEMPRKSQNFGVITYQYLRITIRSKVRPEKSDYEKTFISYSQSATAPSAPAPCEACRRLARFARHYPLRSNSTDTP